MAYRGKAERMANIAMMQEQVRLHPTACLVCHSPNAERHTIVLMNYMGQGINADEDARFEAPMCKRCMHKANVATQAVLASKVKQS